VGVRGRRGGLLVKERRGPLLSRLGLAMRGKSLKRSLKFEDCA